MNSIIIEKYKPNFDQLIYNQDILFDLNEPIQTKQNLLAHKMDYHEDRLF